MISAATELGATALLLRRRALKLADVLAIGAGVGAFEVIYVLATVIQEDHNVVHWSEFDRGGHFAAMEAPDLLVVDMRAFFRALR